MMDMIPPDLSERGFGQSVGFGRKPALLVIDVIQAFTDPDSPLGATATAEVAQTNRLIAAARARAIPALFFTIRYDDAQLSDAGVWIRKVAGLRTLLATGNGSDLDPRLHREVGDALIVKKYASCFFGTDLLSRLVSLGVDTLILSGCTTSGCVRATAVDACQYGLRAVVAQEAVFDRLEASHRQSLVDIQLKYGDVLPVDAVVEALQAMDEPSRPV